MCAPLKEIKKPQPKRYYKLNKQEKIRLLTINYHENQLSLEDIAKLVRITKPKAKYIIKAYEKENKLFPDKRGPKLK